MAQGKDTPLRLRGEMKLPQDVETPLTPLRTPAGTVLYLYVRSADSVSAKTIGQDYVTFRYRGKDLTFAVCDGVGQSFMGDVAARLLGDGLTEWLLKIERPASDEQFSADVRDSLNAMTARTAQEVTDYKLPDSLPPILVQALEMQRKYGSESMFVAGRLAMDGSDPWVALCWLGDAPVAAIDIDGELVDLGPHGHTSERWNATTGIKGEVHTWVHDAKNVARVAGYTDGLGVEHVPTDADLAEMMANWMENPPGDDASLIDIRLAYSPQTVGEAESPDETRRMLQLPAGATEPSFFSVDDTRPIVVEAEPRTPVVGLAPIEAPPENSAVGEWRPLIGTPETLLPKGVAVDDLSKQQQIQMWQQAAILGLTSAALAMMMLDRLQKDEEKKSQKTPRKPNP
jgi:hypothetical protein